ncbi:MAG: hypothetical protein KBT06_05590 [Prevotellaceae bacterium]|nr:hypothetical protein [Candidatus Colivivens equi]
MAKFSGNIGFVVEEETSPGVWTLQTVEREYVGDFLERYQRYEGNENLNDNIVFSDRLSILSDSYATDNLSCIKYVVIDGIKWRANTIGRQYPRLILSIGGVYSG